MFVEDIRTDFYDILLGNRVLLLVHYDVDAICTCKILQGLLKSDNISYTLVPVGGKEELKRAYEDNNEEIKYVLLVNCGGTIDLVDVLQPEEDVVFFVLDSHKPTHVCNVYSDSQVRLVYRDSEENIPNFDDLFRDDDDDEEDEQTESGREGLEAVVERRRERRAWEEKRNTLMFDYTQFSYYGKPSACVAVELSWRMSRCGVGALWAGAVACAASTALCLRASAQALLDAEALHRNQTKQALKDHASVVLEKDACLPLYRSWSLEESLKHSPTLAPYLKLHTINGATKVRQLFADMGFPLQQVRQSYRSMDVELRHSLLTSLESAASKHKLPSPTAATFLLQRPYAPTVPALDLVYIIMALIEHETIPRAEGFRQALAVLDCDSNNKTLRNSFVLAQQAISAVAKVVNSTLASNKLHLAGPFSYFIVQQGTPESGYVKGPLWLGVCSRWASSAWSAGARPVVASVALDDTTCLLLGVPPSQHEPKNLFGAAFEAAASSSGAAVSPEHFDCSVVTLPIAQRARFLDALTALLT